MESTAPWAEPVLMTAEELLVLPEDGWHYELVDGRLMRMAPTGGEHSLLLEDLLAAMLPFVHERGLGRVLTGEPGFWISPPGAPDTVLAPDLAFISVERQAAARVPGFPRMAPDLVVEIVSPSQGRAEMAEKARRWLAAGVRLLWMVFPESRTVDVWHSGRSTQAVALGEELTGEDVIPGFVFPVSDFFD